MTSSAVTMPVLTSSNWLFWSELFTSHMIIKQLDHVLIDARTQDDFAGKSISRRAKARFEKWDQDSKSCLAHMRLAVGAEFSYLIAGAPTAFVALSKLKGRMIAMSMLGANALYGELHSQKKAPSVSVREHLDAMNTKRQLLEAHGSTTISDQQWPIVLINSIPASGSFATTIINLARMVNSGVCSVDDITHQLLETERISNQDVSGADKGKFGEDYGTYAAHSIQSFQPGTNSRATEAHPSRFHAPDSFRSSVKRPICEHCRKRGHQKSSCWILHGRPDGGRQLQSGKRFNSREPIRERVHATTSSASDTDWLFNLERAHVTIMCHSVTALLPQPSVKWFVDSAASRHFCHDISLLCEKEDITPVPIQLGDNSIVYATAKGSVKLPVTSTPTSASHILILHDVLYVKSLTLNLVSVPKLVDDGHFVSFSMEGCSIFDNRKHQVAYALRQSLPSSLYVLVLNDRSRQRSTSIEHKANKRICLRNADTSLDGVSIAAVTATGPSNGTIAAPLSDDAAPLSDDAAPLSDDAAPLCDDAAPLSDDAAPLSDDAAPLCDDAAPLCDDATLLREETIWGNALVISATACDSTNPTAHRSSPDVSVAKSSPA